MIVVANNILYVRNILVIAVTYKEKTTTMTVGNNLLLVRNIFVTVVCTRRKRQQ